MTDSLKKRYIYKLIASILTGLINILLIALVPKSLGPVVYGYFSYTQQFFLQVLSFLDASTSMAFFTKLSAKNERTELISFYFIYSAILFLVLIAGILFFDKYGYINKFLPDIPSSYIYLGLLFGYLTWIIQIFIKISDAYALTVSVEAIRIVHKMLNLFLVVCFIYIFSFNLTIYYYLNYAALLFFIIFLVYLFINKGVFSRELLEVKLQYKSLVIEFYKFCSPLFIFNIVGIGAGLFDIWLLQQMNGSIQTGYYGLAYSLATISLVFTSSLTPVIIREFSRFFDNKNIAEIKRLFTRYVPMLFSIAAYFGVFMSFQSENLLLLFAGESFKEAYLVLVVIAFYPIHQTYGQLIGSVFLATEQTKLYKNIGLVTTFIGFILTCILVYLLEMEAVGLALKMISAQIIAVNIFLFYVSKYLGLEILPLIKHQVLSIVFFTLLSYISSNLVDDLGYGTFINFLIAGMTYTFFVIIGTLAFPKIFATTREEIKAYIDKLK